MVLYREKSTAVATKADAVPSNKADYVITKLDDIVNWARRVRIQGNCGAQSATPSNFVIGVW